MAFDSTLILDDGNDRIIATAPDFPNSTIEAEAFEKQAPAVRSEMISHTQRGAGDQVNRFLLCALVSESAKRIKATAERAGESLPMTMIVRGVLRSYRLAAEDKRGPLAEPAPDIAGLRSLNDKVLRDEIARHSQERVKNSKTRLAHAERLGDVTRIEEEKDGLQHAIELRDRLAKRFR